MTANNSIHTCSYYCERPECVKAQRDELRDRMESVLAQQPAAPSNAQEWVLVPRGAAEIEALRAEVVKLRNLRADAVHECALANIRAVELEETLRELEERVQRDEALLRQALEALLGQRGEPDWHTGKQRENAIAALRERLSKGA